MLPLLFILPGMAELYYVKLQKLNLSDLHLVRITAFSLIFFPLSVAIRAQSEARAFMTRALSRGVNVKIISGTRTYQEQNSPSVTLLKNKTMAALEATHQTRTTMRT